MKPSIDELIDDLTQIRMEQAIDDALIIFSDTKTLQLLVDVTENMQDALAKGDLDEVPNLKQEAQMFAELHAFDIYDAEALKKALLQMQITINKAVITYVKKAYQEAHSEAYLKENMEHLNKLLFDE